jgi:hypothetical protein
MRKVCLSSGAFSLGDKINGCAWLFISAANHGYGYLEPVSDHQRVAKQGHGSPRDAGRYFQDSERGRHRYDACHEEIMCNVPVRHM